MREEQVDYGGALGCLPMFLQTPIWIALYAMVMLTFELRHEGAFFGLFQSITSGEWGFLGDLAEPDKFIPLGFSFNIPLLSGLIGSIESINLLPIILGFVFWAQQKYMTPPPTTPLSPEQETTQKIMKFMIVFMFPLLMYNAPSALALYFITNSTVGIIESKRIRAKVKAEDERREELKKAAANNPTLRKRVANEAEQQPKGFFARMQDAVERRQKELDERRALREKEAKKRKGQ
jgi:YidC/Oxa1 family membrane protein insertase